MICWGMFYKNLKDIIICCKSLQANLEDEGGGTVDKLDIQFLQCQTGYCSEEHIDPSMWHKLCGIKWNHCCAIAVLSMLAEKLDVSDYMKIQYHLKASNKIDLGKMIQIFSCKIWKDLRTFYYITLLVCTIFSV